MPRVRQTNVTAARWSPNGGALGAVDLTEPFSYPHGENVFIAGGAAPPAAEGDLSAPGTGARAGRGARPVAGRRGRARDEGVGTREGRHPLHPRLPAAHRAHRREARLLLRPRRRGRRPGRLRGHRADPGRAGCLVVPDRRRARDVRGARLHRLGPDQPGIHPREPQRRAALHPDRLRVVDGRGARPQDPAAALDGRAVALRDARPAAARRRAVGARVHHGRPRAGVLPDRRAVLLRAPRSDQHRAHPVRRQAGQGARAGRPLLRLDPRAGARLHAGHGARAGQARRAGQDAAQRGGAGPVRDRPDLRELERRVGSPAADDAGDAARGPQVRARLPAPREAVRGRERVGQAQQLVDEHGHRPQPAGARATRRRTTSTSCSSAPP